MKFQATEFYGLFVLEPEKQSDERGFFARLWCREELAEHGLNPHLSQSSIAYNKKKATLRGMHFQKAPFAEAKVVSCIQGKVFDVVIDLRQESSTFKKWFSIELSRENRKMLYIPEGFAHGYLTLEDNSELLYYMSASYEPSASAGVRWNDPLLQITWPEQPKIISKKDTEWPDFINSGVLYASF